MPLGIYLFWPALYLLVGVDQTAPTRWQRWSGWGLLALAVLSGGWPLAAEEGLFYLLFAFMACALMFLLLRVWQPRLTQALLALNVIGGLYAIVNLA